MKLVFLVEKQIIKRVDHNVLVADSNSYVYSQFVFDFCDNVENVYDRSEAIFWKDGETEYVLLDGISSDCKIPDKFLGSGSFKISLILSKDDVIVTTNQVTIDVKPSGFEFVYKPDAYSKLVERIECLEKSVGKLLVTVDDLENRVKVLEGDQNDNAGTGSDVSESDDITNAKQRTTK